MARQPGQIEELHRWETLSPNRPEGQPSRSRHLLLSWVDLSVVYLWDPRGRRRESIATRHPLTPTQAAIYTHHCASPQYTDKISKTIKKDTWHWPLTFACRYTSVEIDPHAHLHKPTPTPLEGSWRWGQHSYCRILLRISMPGDDGKTFFFKY